MTLTVCGRAFNHQDPTTDYMDVIDFLFEEGVSIDDRTTFFGMTSAMLAVFLTPKQPQLLDHLLRKGADPDIPDATGSTALHIAVKNRFYDEVEILMMHRASPHLRDHNGLTPFDYITTDTRISKLFDDLVFKFVCAKCLAPAKKRCVLCRAEFYCSRECLADHKEEHKERCEALQDNHFRLGVMTPSEVRALNATRLEDVASKSDILNLYQAYSEEWSATGRFIVKVDATILNIVSKNDPRVKAQPGSTGFYVSNKSRAFQCALHPSSYDGLKMAGHFLNGKSRVFCTAYLEPAKTQLVLMTFPLLPDQGW